MKIEDDNNNVDSEWLMQYLQVSNLEAQPAEL